MIMRSAKRPAQASLRRIRRSERDWQKIVGLPLEPTSSIRIERSVPREPGRGQPTNNRNRRPAIEALARCNRLQWR